MATISWGKPTLEICKLTDGALPSSPTWTKLETPKEGSTTLETTEGDTTDAYLEGHILLDRKKTASTYALQFQLYNTRTASKPIEDEDGVIVDEYAIRLTPEDTTLPGFMLPKCKVSVVETWSAEEGELWQYVFTALKPANGKMKQAYQAVKQ